MYAGNPFLIYKGLQRANVHNIWSRIRLVFRHCGIISTDKLRRILEDRCEREGRVSGMIVGEGKGGNRIGGGLLIDAPPALAGNKQASAQSLLPSPPPPNILSLSLFHHLSLAVCYDVSLWHCYDFDVGSVWFLKL